MFYLIDEQNICVTKVMEIFFEEKFCWKFLIIHQLTVPDCFDGRDFRNDVRRNQKHEQADHHGSGIQ
jgi:hypothetical protein